MKKLCYFPIRSTVIALSVLFFSQTKAQVLTVSEVFQEQTEWCWAACTKCVLGFYNYSKTQCEIADYTRTVATWHTYGTTDCCTNPYQGCNYWNYNWGYAGSMQDILYHFGNITTTNFGTYFTPAQIQTEINGGHPFIFRWAWNSGGGHFLIGYGISGTDIYYMNPIPGYGYQISDYNWVVSDGSNHTWTHTQKTYCMPSQP